MVDTFYLKNRQYGGIDSTGFEVIFTSNYMQIIPNKENTHMYSEDRASLGAILSIKLMEVGAYRIRSIKSFAEIFKMIHNIIGDDIISYSDLAHTLINDSKLRNYFVHIDSKEAEFDNGEYIIKPYDTGFKLYSTEKKITKNKKSKSGLIYASYTEAYTYIKYRLHWDDLGFSKFNSDLRPTRPNFRSFIDRCFTYYGEGKFIEFDRLHNDLISEIQVLSRKTLTHKEIEAIKLLGTSEENVIAKSPEMGVILKIECTDIYDNNIDFNISLKTSESKASLEQWYKDNKVNLIRLLNYNKRLKYRRINLALYKVDSVTISDGNIMRIVFKKERK